MISTWFTLARQFAYTWLWIWHFFGIYENHCIIHFVRIWVGACMTYGMGQWRKIWPRIHEQNYDTLFALRCDENALHYYRTHARLPIGEMVKSCFTGRRHFY